MISKNRRKRQLGPPTRSQKFRRAKQIISNGQWQKQYYAYHCSHINEWSCQMLVLQNNQANDVVRNISHLEFSHLRRLFLVKNSIQSIQGLCNLRLPYLQYLDLTNNRITSLRPLRRTNFELLQILHVQSNCVSDSDFSPFQFNAPKLLTLSLDYYNYQNAMYQDIAPIAKLQSAKMQQIYFDSKQRIIQKNVIEVLIKKYPHAEIAEQLTLQNRIIAEEENNGEQRQSESSFHSSQEQDQEQEQEQESIEMMGRSTLDQDPEKDY